MKRRAPATLFIGLVSALACRTESKRPTSASLAEGAVAVVGSDRIDAATVLGIATAQGVSVRAARDLALFDALFAASARERFSPALIRQAERSAAARVLLQRLSQQAVEKGAPTDSEVAAATERRSWDLDRPLLLRTTHVVVRVKKPEDDGRARALADRIADAVVPARDPASFRAAALGVPAAGLEVRVEDLDPVARDGRAFDPARPPPTGSAPAHFASAYVDAAYAIRDVGGKSPVTKTEFGYHVILAVERIPENRTPIEERRRILAPEIFAARADKLSADVLEAARQATPVEVERGAMELTESVKATQ